MWHRFDSGRTLSPGHEYWQPAAPTNEATMRWIIDDAGRRWSAERVGRTSGLVSTKHRPAGFPEPADIVRFDCHSDPKEAARETTTRAGLLEQFTESELKALLNSAPRAPAG
jgi:hypothetical protein